jgi:hypothetical protein
MKNLLRWPILQLIMLSTLLLVSACVTDPGLVKNRGLVKDFSIGSNTVGCGTGYLILSQQNVCVSKCDTGTHIASATELTTAKTTTDTTLLARINASAGLCIEDVVVISRPTNQIDIKSDFCSCISGKSDLINDCASTCASRAVTTSPILIVNTIMGTDIALNTKIGNLYNWCNVQLESDNTSPQCFLEATADGSTIRIGVDIASGSNSLSANISTLALDKTYIIKIIEGKSGSGAVSKEFQLRRKTQPTEDTSLLGALKVTPISQYSCLSYGSPSSTSSTNTIIRDPAGSYVRNFYYYPSNETPPPMPPVGGGNQSLILCHDEQLHPGNDSAEYPRLETIPQAFAMWDKTDPRFVNLNNTGLNIQNTLITRMYNEYGVRLLSADIFVPLSYPNRPLTSTTSSASVPLGFIMSFFTDKSGKAYCPTQTEYNAGDQPLFNILKEYMDDTEGLFVGEKEAEIILIGSSYKTIYGSMFVTESVLKTYGFYIENGLKIMATQATMNTKTIYYYWPTSKTMDPLTQGTRKLYTVRAISNLNGNIPTGTSTTLSATDKRIGCVPKTAL